MLIWNGDILKLYAVLGFALLAWREASPRKLLRGGLVLLAVFYLAYSSVAIGIALSSSGQTGSRRVSLEAPAEVSRARGPEPRTRKPTAGRRVPDRIVPGGDRATRADLFSPRQFVLLLAGLLYILPLFMLGSWLATREMHVPYGSEPTPARRVLRWSALGGIGSSAGSSTTRCPPRRSPRDLAGAGRSSSSSSPHLRPRGLLPAMLVALSHARPGSRVLAALAPMGRMALTNYLLHSVLVTWLMYGYGLGMMRRAERDHPSFSARHPVPAPARDERHVASLLPDSARSSGHGGPSPTGASSLCAAGARSCWRRTRRGGSSARSERSLTAPPALA